METPIELMYKAAKTEIPAEASHVARIANHLEKCLSVMDLQSARAGEPKVLTSMLHVGGDMHAVLRRAVTAMDNCSVAVLVTADDYVATDAQARAHYEKMSSRLKNATAPSHHPTTALPHPEAPGATIKVPNPPILPPTDNTVTIEPTEDPVDPQREREERGDGGGNQPGIPGIDREWD